MHQQRLLNLALFFLFQIVVEPSTIARASAAADGASVGSFGGVSCSVLISFPNLPNLKSGVRVWHIGPDNQKAGSGLSRPSSYLTTTTWKG